MAFNFGGISSWILKMVINPLIWLLIIIGILGFTLLFLKIRKKRRMRYPAVEIVDLGEGKTCLNTLKCGWIGKTLWFRGLWWTGRDIMRTDANEEILDFSEEDYNEVNGKRGVIFYRDPISRTLVPINKLKVINKDLIANIPPAEFIDSAISIVKEAEKETRDWKEKIVMWGLMGGIIIFSLISVILIIQMVKNGQKEASNLILESGRTCLENAKAICSQISSEVGKTGGSTAP